METKKISLEAIREKRDAATTSNRKWSCWKCSAEEITLAYDNGERDFRLANLEGAYLAGARLEDAHLEGAHLAGANLVGANLVGARLAGANLESANLTGVSLYGANLVGAHLEGAHLVGANLVGANLVGARLAGANLESANLYGADLDEGFHILQVGPVGSRRAYLDMRRYPDGRKEINTGCFSGSPEEFVAEVNRKPADDPYRKEYETLIVPLVRAFFAQFETN